MNISILLSLYTQFQVFASSYVALCKDSIKNNFSCLLTVKKTKIT